MIRRFLILFAFLLYYYNMCAQRFASSQLEQSVIALDLHGLAELPSGYSQIEHQGLKLSIIKRGDRVDHVGRCLFPDLFRHSNPLPVYNYLEYAWLEQSMLANDNPYKYRQVVFGAGDWKSLSLVNEETPCSVAIEDGAHYRVAWYLPDGQTIEVSLPVNYEMISTASRGELERAMIEDLRMYQLATTPEAAPAATYTAEQFREQPDGIFVAEGDRYLLSGINQNLYFVRQSEGEYQLLCDTIHLEYTLSNMFCGTGIVDEAWQLHILFNLHESKQDTVSLSLPAFVDYLRSSGCSLFWGIEEQGADRIVGSLYAYSPNAGYNHIFKVTCDRRQVHHLSCIGSLYVPTTNVRDLHMQYKPKTESQRIKWQ